MKNFYPLETTPVLYGPSAIKTIDFEISQSHTCFRVHWHDRMELLRIKSGKMEVTLGSRTFVAEQNSVVIIPPHTPHMGTAVTDCKYKAIMFDVRSFLPQNEAAKKYLTPIFDGTASFCDFTADKEILATVDSFSKNDFAGATVLSCIGSVYSFFSLLYTKCLSTFENYDSFDKTVKKAIEFIEQNCDKKITEESVARHLGYSVPYFCKKFKSGTGLSPMSYLKIFRVEKAYSLIVNDKLKIGEAAAICGFSDANYFTRCFKSHFGHPPTYYIKN